MLLKRRYQDYTVGWVCALPIEQAAAYIMLDEVHGQLEQDINNNDENLYILGSMRKHNVVILCLPAGRIGTAPAAAAATHMTRTFKRIRHWLMVGIGGGVPSATADIRLGDVVVSQPNKTFGGVVQYDMGKKTSKGIERIGQMNSPSPTLLQAVSAIRAKEHMSTELYEYISALEAHANFQRSNAGRDVLFDASYDHRRGETCKKCSPSREKCRKSREKTIAVHYGTIASGNQVIKNATQRDRISEELGGVLCFEMEAAGRMNIIPCLVVRGICDYADSHKNKEWQPYAAGTAAAYAKEILSVIPAIPPKKLTVKSSTVSYTKDRKSSSSPIRPESEDGRSDVAPAKRKNYLKWKTSIVDLFRA
jgi:nucleoside phosphorylase